MATLRFYDSFMRNDLSDSSNNTVDIVEEYDSKKTYGPSFFHWLRSRFVSFITFDSQGRLYSLLWHWMHYFHREFAGLYRFLLIGIPVALAIGLLVVSNIVALGCLVIVPTTTLWPTLLTALTTVLNFSLLALCVAYIISAAVVAICEISALISYFITSKQWRKTPTVTRYILSTILDERADINQIKIAASAINVIYGKERKQCAYEILNTLRWSTFTATTNGAKKFAALVCAFERLGIFNRYLALAGENCTPQASSTPILRGEYQYSNYRKSNIHIGNAENNRSAFVYSVYLNSNYRRHFHTKKYHIANLELFVHSIRFVTEIAQPQDMNDNQCAAIAKFIETLRSKHSETTKNSHKFRLHHYEFMTDFLNISHGHEQKFSNDKKISGRKNDFGDDFTQRTINHISGLIPMKTTKMFAMLYKHTVLEPNVTKCKQQLTSIPSDLKEWKTTLLRLFAKSTSDRKNTNNDKQITADPLTLALRENMNTSEASDQKIGVPALVANAELILNFLDQLCKQNCSIHDHKKFAAILGFTELNNFEQFKAWFRKFFDHTPSPKSIDKQADRKETKRMWTHINVDNKSQNAQTDQNVGQHNIDVGQITKTQKIRHIVSP